MALKMIYHRLEMLIILVSLYHPSLHYIGVLWISLLIILLSVKPSSMATQNSIPLPDLTDVDKAIIFQILDAELNSVIFYSLLSGEYDCSSK